eukprot:Pgem_evm1s10636
MANTFIPDKLFQPLQQKITAFFYQRPIHTKQYQNTQKHRMHQHDQSLKTRRNANLIKKSQHIFSCNTNNNRNKSC